MLSKALNLLIVDDDHSLRSMLSFVLGKEGYQVEEAQSAGEALKKLKSRRFDLVISDIRMPDLNGIELLKKIKIHDPDLPVIMITAYAATQDAIEAMKLGAEDYIMKPFNLEELKIILDKSLRKRSLERENIALRQKLSDREKFEDIVGADPQMTKIYELIRTVAQTDSTVLISGESGTGKELIARAIHLAGDPARPFVAVNVAGLDDNMFSDTLFGHKKGAFTGAESSREGLISQAQDGTLFLDEIGDLSPTSQVKLLRLIQEKEYYTLGMDQPRKTNARLICSTNHDLRRRVEQGAFRNDLYFRLNTHVIAVPPLRERREDLPLLLGHFLQESARLLRKRVPTPPPELLGLLSAYDFPGNVRELQTMVADAVSRHRSGVLSMESFRAVVGDRLASRTSPGGTPGADLAPDAFLASQPTLKQAEEFLVRRALEQAKGNQGIAAQLLGITRQALNKRLVRGKKKA